MKKKIVINCCEATEMGKSDYFFLRTNAFDIIQINKNEIDDLIDLLNRVKQNYSHTVHNTSCEVKE